MNDRPSIDASAVSWRSPARGAYTRQMRLGEWIGGPVTPLFESWLLTAIEERMHAEYRRWLGQIAPRPYHVIVNGWYFYSINFLAPPALLRSLPGIIWHVLRDPRRAAGVIPPTVRHSVPVFEREWRQDLQPRYRAAIEAAAARVEDLPLDALPGFIDELAELAGEYFVSITALSGAAYKMEMNLARFHRRHLAGVVDGGHLPLLAGFEPPADPGSHALVSIDWWHAPARAGGTASEPAREHAQVVARREAAEEAAFGALAANPGRLASYRRLLAETQRLVPIREEQTAEWTIAWPVLRRAVVRIGEGLAEAGALPKADDVFFLSRDEALAAIRGLRTPDPAEILQRRAVRADQARLVPPSLIGDVPRAMRALWERYPRAVGATRSDRALVSGTPASAGRATGPVRVVLGVDGFDELEPGEVLVAPMTAPAWTPLFTRAAAVVTDVGGPAAHASIIAREYGIPAVVGCGDATVRLSTGMLVTVDGSTGNVEMA